jgi:hypothetical protein
MLKLLSIAAIALPLIAVAGPSLATKGIDAARACDKNPKCTALYDDAGGVVIIVGETVIDCPGPQKDCSVVKRTKLPGGAAGNNLGSVATLSR